MAGLREAEKNKGEDSCKYYVQPNRIDPGARCEAQRALT